MELTFKVNIKTKRSCWDLPNTFYIIFLCHPVPEIWSLELSRWVRVLSFINVVHPTSCVFLKLWYLITLLIDERFFLFFLCVLSNLHTIATYNCTLRSIAGFLDAEAKTIQKNRLFCKLRVFVILNSDNFQESKDK